MEIKMKKLLNLIFVLMLILIYSCTDQIINTVVDNGEVNRINKRLIPEDSLIINPDKPLCGTKDVTVWLVDHYTAKDGKIVGIWPHNNRMQSSTEIEKLKNKFGFNYILLANSYDVTKLNLLIAAGFPRTNIMAQIVPANYISKINSFGNIYGYYLDEPDYWDYGLGTVINISQEVHTHSTSKFIIGDFKRTLIFTYMVIYADYAMFTAYDHWWECLGYWCSWPTDPDQRPDWTDMKDRYSTKSIMNWVGAHKDLSEYPLLLGHSQNLNLPGIWLYQLNEVNNSDDNIYSFCERAWISGYLRKFERKYVYEYHCLYPDPCDCDPNSNYGWYLFKVWEFSDIREAFYQP
jgi:hypothetical protein